MKNQKQPNSAEGFILRVITFADKGDYDAAIADYTQAISLDPNFTAAYISRGLAKNSDHETKRVDYTKVNSINPNKPHAEIYRGYAYWEIGEYDAAIAEFTQAISIDPDNIVAKQILSRLNSSL
ncbi:hypothetical protein FACS189468_9390 [Spirochaetia bacterium]|nr:hypothetical protein FACS189468_9390 [Spirochaetia bacterium]